MALHRPPPTAPRLRVASTRHPGPHPPARVNVHVNTVKSVQSPCGIGAVSVCGWLTFTFSVVY